MASGGREYIIGAPELTVEEVAAEKTIFTLADLLSMEIDEAPRLFYPIFVKSGIAVLVGGSDTGKSSLLRQMAMCVATGRDFLTWKYKGEHHRAIYLSSEDDATITAAVVKKYDKTMKLPDAAKSNLRFRFDLNSDNVVEGLEQMLSEQASDLIVIDALADFFNGRNLSDNKEVRSFYAPFKEIARRHKCLIIFNHHTGKRTSAYTPDKDNSLGSQAIEAAPRLVIEFRTDPHDLEVKHFCVVKCNYLSTEYKTKSFSLRMDKNFVFVPTGGRTDFLELAKRPDKKSRTAPKAINPDNYTKYASLLPATGMTPNVFGREIDKANGKQVEPNTKPSRNAYNIMHRMASDEVRSIIKRNGLYYPVESAPEEDE